VKSDFDKTIPQLEKLREKHVKTIEKLTRVTWSIAAKKDIERANNRIVEISAVIRSKKDQPKLF